MKIIENKAPAKYLLKSLSKSSKHKNKYNFLTKVEKVGSLYKVEYYKWSYIMQGTKAVWGYYLTTASMEERDFKYLFDASPSEFL